MFLLCDENNMFGSYIFVFFFVVLILNVNLVYFLGLSLGKFNVIDF